MTIPIFQGLESPDHRKTLLAARELFVAAPPITVSVSYKSLMTRKEGNPYLEKLARDFTVIMEAGYNTIALQKDAALDMQDEYYDFVAACPHLTYFIQFEHPSLDAESMKIPADTRAVPLFTGYASADDIAHLEHLLDTYGSAAFPYRGDKRIAPILRRSKGVSIALGQPDLEEAYKQGFTAAMSNAWLTPGRFGEIIVWDGARFRRSNSLDRDKTFEKHRAYLDRVGFDTDLLEKRDARESIRLAAYSYLSYSQYLSRNTSDTLAGSTTEKTTIGASGSTTTVVPARKVERPPVPFPVFATDSTTTLEESPDGTSSIVSRTTLRAAHRSIRSCDTCFLASTCPAFEANASCAFNMPIEVRTDAQVKALLYSIIELQTARVSFARFAEETSGGMPDPAVGVEMDRLLRITDRVRLSEERRERLTVSVEAESLGSTQSGAAGGVLSKIFGTSKSPEPEIVVGEVLGVADQSDR